MERRTRKLAGKIHIRKSPFALHFADPDSLQLKPLNRAVYVELFSNSLQSFFRFMSTIFHNAAQGIEEEWKTRSANDKHQIMLGKSNDACDVLEVMWCCTIAKERIEVQTECTFPTPQ